MNELDPKIRDYVIERYTRNAQYNFYLLPTEDIEPGDEAMIGVDFYRINRKEIDNVKKKIKFSYGSMDDLLMMDKYTQMLVRVKKK